MRDGQTGSVYRRWGKRSLDVVLGSALALLAAPLILVLSVASAVSFRAWPIFVQPRVGRAGRRFSCLKIRSLPATAPPAADKHEVARIPTSGLGRFLRATHLDELPQLFLVPLGVMSLVGPRPAIPELLERFPSRALDARLRVRPGCTGLWQVSEAAHGPIYASPEYDRFYVTHCSLKLDVQILVKTVLVMFTSGSTLRERAEVRADESAEPVVALREHVPYEPSAGRRVREYS
jgi:lipopolysaccharide/colanic/teichoic acid biosynthesis glycosyltransferase